MQEARATYVKIIIITYAHARYMFVIGVHIMYESTTHYSKSKHEIPKL